MLRAFPRPDPSSAPPPVEHYLTTVVTIDVGPRRIVVRPDPTGGAAMPRTHLAADAVHVVTAANPWSVELEAWENEERNAEAAAVLDALGLRHVPAEGTDPAGTWAEPGFALLDAPDERVLGLAAAWCQHGIYRWDARGWWLVLSDGSPPQGIPVRVEQVP